MCAYNISMERTLEQQFLTEEVFGENISKLIPPPKQILDELHEFIAVLYGALDDANPKATEFLKHNGRIRKANNQLYPHLIRFLVHNYLDDEGIKTQLVNENDEVIREEEYPEPKWEHNILASNGIAGMIAGYNFRVLKALKALEVEQKLPPPGSSDTDSPKRKFYCQNHLKGHQLYLVPPDKPTKPTSKPNIIFLWDVDRNNAIILYLSVPRWGNSTKAKAYYTELIPHPATTISSDAQETKSLEEITKNTINLEKR